MQTHNITNNKANDIIRSCVHCGFCLATCPTYQLLGNELDSPRGRIYLIKYALEEGKTSKKSLNHLDRCLTCRACETTCPSGVEYGQLLDIGRNILEKERPIHQKISRFIMRKTLTSALFPIVGFMARHSKITTQNIELSKPSTETVLLLSGCIQPSLAPNINSSAKQVLHRLGVEVIQTPNGECCGALDEHLAAKKSALKKIRHNINAWNVYLDDGISCIISTASGCGVMVKDYPDLFDTQSEDYIKASRISKATKDIAEFVLEKLNNASDEQLAQFSTKSQPLSVHTPCTLQHGQQLPKILPKLLTKLGYIITQPKDDHLCCGSAGTYSIFQPKLAQQLKKNKLQHLQASKPEVIVTANIGCLMHLQKGSKTPVKHWIELLAH